MRILVTILIMGLGIFASDDAFAWRARLVKDPETYQLRADRGYLLFVVESDFEFHSIKMRKYGSVEENPIVTKIKPGKKSYLLEFEPGDYQISQLLLDGKTYVDLRKRDDLSLVILAGYVNYAGHFTVSDPYDDNDVHSRLINRSSMAFIELKSRAPGLVNRSKFAYTHVTTYDEFFSRLAFKDDE